MSDLDDIQAAAAKARLATCGAPFFAAPRAVAGPACKCVHGFLVFHEAEDKAEAPPALATPTLDPDRDYTR